MEVWVLWNMRIATFSHSAFFMAVCRLLFLTLIKYIFLVYWLQYYFTFFPESECNLWVCVCVLLQLLFHAHEGILFLCFFSGLSQSQLSKRFAIYRICIRMCFWVLLISSGISYKINPHLNVIWLYIYSYFLCVTLFVSEFVWHFLFLAVYLLP